MVCYAMLYYTMVSYTVLYYTMVCYTILYYGFLYYAILYYAVLYHPMLYNAMLYCTMLCYLILYYAIVCYATLYYTHTIILFTCCWGDSECLTLKLAERGILLASRLRVTNLKLDVSKTVICFVALQPSSREFEYSCTLNSLRKVYS